MFHRKEGIKDINLQEIIPTETDTTTENDDNFNISHIAILELGNQYKFLHEAYMQS